MSEMLEEIDAKALRLLLKTQGTYQARIDHLLELIVVSLVSPEGDLVCRPTSDLDPVNWDLFLKAEFEDPEGLAQQIYQIMSAEDRPIPDDPDNLPDWAEDMVLLYLEATGLLLW